MELHYLDRKSYRQKHEPDFIAAIRNKFGPVYILPEGGSNRLAIQGCEEIVTEIKQPFDIICCASGTGATLAGIVSAINAGPAAAEKTAIGFSALKGGDFLVDEVRSFLPDKIILSNWHIESRYHFGGYAKLNDELVGFMKSFYAQHNIELDAVYTGKMFYGLYQLIASGAFPAGSRIIAVHSGGLQGNRGFNL